MTRIANAPTQTALDQAHVVYAYLVSLDFVSGMIRLFNGNGQLQYNGNTFIGAGDYGSISGITESTELRAADPLTLTLSGVTPNLIASAKNRTDYFGRSALVNIAVFDNKRKLLTPIESAVWEGRMDQMLIARDAGGASISLVCENRLAIWNHTGEILFTDEWQQLLYSGDVGLDQLTTLTNKIVVWGGQKVAPNGTNTGGGYGPFGIPTAPTGVPPSIFGFPLP